MAAEYHDITEILLKVALNTIKQTYGCCNLVLCVLYTTYYGTNVFLV